MSTCWNRILGTGIGLTLLLLPLQMSWAAGVYFSGNGTVSSGRAEATVATGQGADAVIHNPANLSKLWGFGVRLDAMFSYQTATFQRDPLTPQITFEKISKRDAPAFIPSLAMWYGIPKVGPGSLTLSLFFFPPHGRSGYVYPETAGECSPAATGDATVCKKIPEPGPNRTTLIKTASTTFFVGAGAAYEWRPSADVKLRVGATFMVQYINAVQRQTLFAISGFGLYNPKKTEMNRGEVIMQIDATGLGYTGNFGISASLPYGFHVGASLFLPVVATLGGKLEALVDETLVSLAKLELQGNEIDIVTGFPMFFRAGVGWSGYGLTVEVATVVEVWSGGASKQILKPKGIKFSGNVGQPVNVEIPDINIDLNFHDSFSLRVGAEYNIANWVMLRAGWWFETGALDEQYQSVATIDYPNRMALTAGLSVRVPMVGVMVDFSVMHIFGRTITIKNSPITPIDVSPEGFGYPGGVPSTSNGTYEFGNTTIYLGVRGNWGPGASPRGMTIPNK